MAGAALKLTAFFIIIVLPKKLRAQKQQTEMSPQGDCRNKQPEGWSQECVWEVTSLVAYTDTSNVHRHLEKHHLVRVEEVMNSGLLFH